MSNDKKNLGIKNIEYLIRQILDQNTNKLIMYLLRPYITNEVYLFLLKKWRIFNL